MDNSTILYIVIIAVLFLLVLRNNRNNRRKLYDRKGRDFRGNYEAKKKERLSKDEKIED